MESSKRHGWPYENCKVQRLKMWLIKLLKSLNSSSCVLLCFLLQLLCENKLFHLGLEIDNYLVNKGCRIYIIDVNDDEAHEVPVDKANTIPENSFGELEGNLLGRNFKDVEECYELYNNYAFQKGFSVRKGKQYYGKMKGFWMITCYLSRICWVDYKYYHFAVLLE